MSRKQTLVEGWSCDERKRETCLNGHGCHCREITSLFQRVKALTKERDQALSEVSVQRQIVYDLKYGITATTERDAAEQRLAEVTGLLDSCPCLVGTRHVGSLRAWRA